MAPLLLSFCTFLSTMSGGIFALKNQRVLHYILGFTAGVIMGVFAFDLTPEIFHEIQVNHLSTTPPTVALVVGFLLFHIVEKTVLIHHAHETEYGKHHHPQVGIISALALSGHSFLDGVGIGLGFQVSPVVGLAVAIAVIGHDFADGLNTVTLMLTNKNGRRRSAGLLLVDATAPVVGVLSTRLFHLSHVDLVLYLSFFAGFLLYIGASDILPQAHEENSNALTVVLTISGALFMFIMTRFA